MKNNQYVSYGDLIAPANSAVLDMHTELQRNFILSIEKNGIDHALAELAEIKSQIGDHEFSFPSTVIFENHSTSRTPIEIEFSEFEDFHKSRIISIGNDPSEIDNLKINTKYFWRSADGVTRSFLTASQYPRFIHIDGLVNVRDLGSDKIKQGILYRGCELGGHYLISPQGQWTFVNELCIKTELDLRLEAMDYPPTSPCGEDVKLVRIPYRPYREIFEDRYKKAIVEIMELFSHSDAYPIYFHCWGGADRTGMIALFLKALSGESDESIHLDYELTSLSTITSVIRNDLPVNNFRRRTSDYYIEFLNMIGEYAPNAPLSHSVEAFLLSCGVTKECIDKIKNIIMK